jgi:Prophage protein (DUF1660)
MSVMCRLLGHQPLFRADGRTMRWACERCGQAEGAKEYDTTADAQRYATAFNRRDASNLGKRAPLIGLLPLRLWRMIRRR